MPLARKETGYPVEASQAAVAVAEKPVEGNGQAAAPRVIKSSTDQAVQPSAKDRSIVRQVAWKVVGFAMANWTGTPDAWFEKCVELRAKVEKDILEA